MNIESNVAAETEGALVKVVAPAEMKRIFKIEHVYVPLEKFDWTMHHDLAVEDSNEGTTTFTGGRVVQLAVNDGNNLNLNRWQPTVIMYTPPLKPVIRWWSPMTWWDAWKHRNDPPVKLEISCDDTYTIERRAETDFSESPPDSLPVDREGLEVDSGNMPSQDADRGVQKSNGEAPITGEEEEGSVGGNVG
jgi:hypothetical protein